MAIGNLKRPQYRTAISYNNTVCEQATNKQLGCPNKFNSGENSNLIRQSLATNMKAFSKQQNRTFEAVVVWQASTMETKQ